MDHLFGFAACITLFDHPTIVSLDNQNIKSVMPGSTESKEYETVGTKSLSLTRDTTGLLAL